MGVQSIMSSIFIKVVFGKILIYYFVEKGLLIRSASKHVKASFYLKFLRKFLDDL